MHGVNENIGLLPAPILAKLLFYYLGVSLALAVIARLVVKQFEKSIVFCFLLLLTFFFFGVFKDIISNFEPLASFVSYRLIIPTILICLFGAAVFIYRKNASFSRLSILLVSIVVLNLAIEIGHLTYNIISNNARHQDFGDSEQLLIKSVDVKTTEAAPDVFWIVLDEYSASSVLSERWGFANPLDTMLQSKGFFVAEKASSSYNYTQYSLLATLDMQYLNELDSGSIITYRDIVRGQHSLEKTNVVELFKKLGYRVNNYSISDMEGLPASDYSRFRFDPGLLIDNQTIPGRISLDIAWSFPYLFVPGKVRDSTIADKVYRSLQATNDSLLAHSMNAFRRGVDAAQPSFFMLHTMFSHDPFIYNADGTLNIQDGLGIRPDRYIPAIQYTNAVVNQVIDSIQNLYMDRNIVIILQGDHGFKFKESDPFYRTSMCKVLYAVYNSDGNHSMWKNDMNTVNTFRVFFNKYFKTQFPELPNRSFYLYYR